MQLMFMAGDLSAIGGQGAVINITRGFSLGAPLAGQAMSPVYHSLEENQIMEEGRKTASLGVYKKQGSHFMTISAQTFTNSFARYFFCGWKIYLLIL